MADGKRSGSKAVAMAALRVGVEFGGDFELLECLCVEEDIFNVYGIVFGLEEEGGRRSG